MLADFYIPMLSNDMKIPAQKNHLVGQILYSLFPSKKRRLRYAKLGVRIRRSNLRLKKTFYAGIFF